MYFLSELEHQETIQVFYPHSESGEVLTNLPPTLRRARLSHLRTGVPF
jgi:hypothetical protein